MSSTDVALRSSEVPANFREQMHMAAALADSDLLPRHLRGKPSNVLVILQGARALDVSAFWALQSMHVIEGKLGMAAELMRGLVIRAGHEFNIIERTSAKATVEIIRSDKPGRPYRASFTIHEAAEAKLTGKDNWRHYPAAMLLARATSIAVRDECPDVLFGVVYTPEELGARVDEEGVPQADANGNVVLDGEVVEVPTDDEVAGWAAAIMEAENLHELAPLMSVAIDRGARDRAVAPGDADTIATYAAYRLVLSAGNAAIKEDIRDLYRMANTWGLLATEVVQGPSQKKITVRDALTAFATTLPEVAPDAMSEHEPGTPLVDTDHARSLRDAAAASWSNEQEEPSDA